MHIPQPNYCNNL